MSLIGRFCCRSRQQRIGASGPFVASSGEDVEGARLDLVVALAEVQGVEVRDAIDIEDGLAVERQVGKKPSPSGPLGAAYLLAQGA